MTGIKPKDAIGLKEVPLVNEENNPPEDTLQEDILYQVLGQKPPRHKPPTKTPWTKTPHSKIFVFHFLKIFMVSQVHNLR